MNETRSPLFAAPALTLAALLSSCSADFKDGVTTCSAQNLCPEGFYCDIAGGKKCRKNGSPPVPGTGGMSVVPGTGGMSVVPGAGGNPVVPGTGGMTPLPPPVDMAPPRDMAVVDNRPPPAVDMAGPNACTDPMFPQSCPDRNGVRGGCFPAGVDCSTLTKCGMREFACRNGSTPNCQYPSNPCGPTNNVCPTSGGNQQFTKFCPAAGGAGPVCVPPALDCATLKACGDEFGICEPGETVDCSYAVNRCVFPPTGCTNPMFPVYCAGMGMIGPGCASAGADCTTRTLCPDGELEICRVGFKVDCTRPEDMRCLPK